MHKKDPIGNAIWDFHNDSHPEDITVKSDFMEDDFMPIHYLFRKFDDFPELEKIAMQYCKGKVLDIGAGAGPHTSYLLENDFDVSTIEISSGAHRYLKETLPKAQHFHGNLYDFHKKGFDTILLLMNGIGLANNFNNIVPFLKHLANLLNEDGRILCESTDVADVFKDQDGSIWIDLSVQYYGEFNFKMIYKESESDWFTWVYLDRKNFKNFANEAGLTFEILYDEDEAFLVELKKKK
ncbi:MAG: methyltransferase domain-containing protein [Brumimicrobium sp.]